MNESSYEFVVNDDVNAKEQETGSGDDDKGLLLVNSGLFEESGEIVPIIINGLVDIVDINMMNITSDEVERFLFGDLKWHTCFTIGMHELMDFLLTETKL